MGETYLIFFEEVKKFHPQSMWFQKFKCAYGDKGIDSETVMGTVALQHYSTPQTSQSSVTLSSPLLPIIMMNPAWPSLLMRWHREHFIRLFSQSSVATQGKEQASRNPCSFLDSFQNGVLTGSQRIVTNSYLFLDFSSMYCFSYIVVNAIKSVIRSTQFITD